MQSINVHSWRRWMVCTVNIEWDLHDCNAIGYKYIFGKSPYGSLMVCLLFVIIVQSPIHPIPPFCAISNSTAALCICLQRQLGKWQADTVSLSLHSFSIYGQSIISAPFTHIYTLRTCIHRMPRFTHWFEHWTMRNLIMLSEKWWPMVLLPPCA